MESLMPPKTKPALDIYLYGPNGPLPFMSEEESTLHKRYIRGKDVLELGGGGSTLYFSLMTKNYTCIEGHPIWYGALLGMKMYHEDLYSNVKLIYAPCDLRNNKEKTNPIYLDAIRALGDKKFDAIIVDCSHSCRLAATKIVHDNNMTRESILFWHEYYHYLTPEQEEYVKNTFDIIAIAPGTPKTDPNHTGNLAVMKMKIQ